MQENKPEKKNEIIEKLIKHFDGYINNFRDRLKINSIFNIFENKIREDLNTLVYNFNQESFDIFSYNFE